jgi:glycosyltransferase involved in cell wall biosynthesis
MLRALCLNQSTGRESQVLRPLAGEEALWVRLAGRAHATYVRMRPWRAGARWVAQLVPGLFDRDLAFHEFRWHVVEAARGYAAISRIRRRVPRDVAHVTGHSLAFGMGRVMQELPVVVSAAASAGEWARMGIWTDLRPYTDMMTAPSLAMERHALERAALVRTMKSIRQSVPRAHIVSHHPGIDTARLGPAARSKRGLSRLLFVGGRFREKGGEDLLKALDPYIGTEIELDVVTPQAVAGRDGLRVHHFWRDDAEMLDLFQQANLLCLPTHGDAVPCVVLEALACGTPVISATVGAIPELLWFGKCGLILRPGDIRSLRDSVVGLLANRARRIAMGNRGRAEIELRFDARRQGGSASRAYGGCSCAPRACSLSSIAVHYTLARAFGQNIGTITMRRAVFRPRRATAH